MGGDPEKGRQHLEKALELTGRKATLVQVNYAQGYAVQKNDKALFTKLLHEAIETPIPKGDLALPNTIAKRRAERLLAQADTLIMTPLEDLPAPANAPGEPAAEDAPADGAGPESSATTPGAPAAAEPPKESAPAGKPAPVPAAKQAPAPAAKPAPAKPAPGKPAPVKPAQ
jgi:hypothetical protein